jgi:hypothetical protein
MYSVIRSAQSFAGFALTHDGDDLPLLLTKFKIAYIVIWQSYAFKTPSCFTTCTRCLSPFTEGDKFLLSSRKSRHISRSNKFTNN